MATYGVTHIKKDNLIISFSDSCNGSLSAMGKQNLKSIKYMPCDVLNKLFDDYTASAKVKVGQENAQEEEISEPTPLTSRIVEEVVHRVGQDTHDHEAIEWMSRVLKQDMSTGSFGFAPLLYLNINPHYGRHYDECDYLIDLDKQRFVYRCIEIPFEWIRQASEHKIDYFCSMNLKLVKRHVPINQSLEDLANEYDEAVQSRHYAHASLVMEKIGALCKAYFDIDERVLVDFDDSPVLAARNSMQERDPGAMQEFGGFSVHSADIPLCSLRPVLHLLQQLRTYLPEASFLTHHTQWGCNNTYTMAGIHVFSPMEMDVQMQSLHDCYIEQLKEKLKIGFNVLNASGKWHFNFEHNEMFLEKLHHAGPHKSLFSLDEIKVMDVDNIIFSTLHPYLLIHADYRQARKLLLAGHATTSSPVVWSYMALLNRDREVFEKVYPQLRKNLTLLDEEACNIVRTNCLQSLWDSQTVDNIMQEMASVVSKELSFEHESLAQFISYLKKTSFFEDVHFNMTEAEKKRYHIYSFGHSKRGEFVSA